MIGTGTALTQAADFYDGGDHREPGGLSAGDDRFLDDAGFYLRDIPTISANQQLRGMKAARGKDRQSMH